MIWSFLFRQPCGIARLTRWRIQRVAPLSKRNEKKKMRLNDERLRSGMRRALEGFHAKKRKDFTIDAEKMTA
jgi:hypothetical protein